MALVFDDTALKVQSYYRLTISALVVLLSHLGFVFYAGSDKKYVDIAKKVMSEFSHQSPAPQQTFKPVQQHNEPIFNRMFVNRPAPVAQSQAQPVRAGHVEDLAEQMYDDTPRPAKGFIGFVDTDRVGKIEVKKVQSTATEEIKDKVQRPSIGTKNSTQSGTEQKKSTASKGRGKSAGLEFQVIDNAFVSGDFFKFKDTASIRNLVDYSKYISPNDSGIGKDTASVYMTMLKEKNRPLSKKQWEDLKGQQ
jgi:hypothetical protein